MTTENKGSMQGIATGLEISLRNEYRSAQGGLGGIITADYIRAFKGSFYYCMVMVLSRYYFDQNVNAIDKFIEKISDIKEMKMDDIENKRAENIYDEFNKVHESVK